MRKVFQFLAAVAAVCVPFSASADILWDQQANNAGGNFVDQQFSDFPTFSTYNVSDATFGSAVTVTDVTVYLTDGNAGLWAGVTSGVLNIFDGNGLVGGDDPTSGGDFGPGAVSVTYTSLGNNVGALTASGLNINLAAGTYWFGLTADAAFATFFQEFHWQATSNVGANSFGRNPGGAFGFGTDWFDIAPVAGFGDLAFKVEGFEAIPEPSTLGVLMVGLAGLAFRRRR